MADTTADVRRDLEQTRERMSSTISELEHKLNVVQVVKDHPWPALAVAVGAGLALSQSGADTKAAAATVAVTKGSSSRVGSALDDIVANLLTGVQGALQQRLDGWVDELKTAIGGSASTSGSPNRPRGVSYGVGPMHESPGGMHASTHRAD